MAVRRKLWNRDFVLLLQGGAVSTLGDVMYSVAIGFWVYQTTGSSALMGLMSSISMFVTMFLSPFCGSLIDKCNRKWVIVLIDALQGVLMLTVGVLAYAGELRVPIVLIAAGLAAFGSVLYSPALSTIMLDIIPRDDMVRGQSIHSGTSALIDLVGSAISGAVVAFIGVPLTILCNGVSNLYSAVTEMFVRVPKTSREGERVTVRGMATDLWQAARGIFADPCLRIFVPGVLILNLLSAGPMTLLLPFCLEKGFTVDMYGYLIAIMSGAYVVGSVLLGAIKLKPRARFLLMSIGFVLSELLFLSVYLSVSFVLMCALAFLAGLANCAGNTILNASLMLALPEDNRSATLGFIRSSSVGGSALSAVLYGLLGEVAPLHIVFAIGSTLTLVPMLLLCFHHRTRQFILTHEA